MKAVEFDSQIANRDRIEVPPHVAEQIPEGSTVRVILLYGPDEDANWRELALRSFSSAYSAEDAVYEKLLDGTEPR